MSDLPNVKGRCPACGGDSLFLGQGNYITCARGDCKDPGAATDLLDRPPYHVIDVGEDGWALQHEVTCLPDMLSCEVHRRASEWTSLFCGPPLPLGRFRLGLTSDGMLALGAEVPS